MFGEMVVEKGYSFAQENDWMGRLEKDWGSSASSPKGGARQHGRPADGSDGSRRGGGLHAEMA